MPRTERSAGVVVFRTLPNPPKTRLYLLLDYGRHWDYPKGHVERGETDQATAIRELKEETGIDAQTFVPGFAREISYFFRHAKRGLIRKTVIFFAAEVNSDTVVLSDEHVGYAFLPYEQARQRLTFASARELLREAEIFLTGSTVSRTV
jgi:8-oxo-dGTP pyrophosphatase MutT (NUDIX family)